MADETSVTDDTQAAAPSADVPAITSAPDTPAAAESSEPAVSGVHVIDKDEPAPEPISPTDQEGIEPQ